MALQSVGPSDLRSRMLAGPIGRTLFRLTLPNTVSALLQSAIIVVDAAYVGRLGTVALAGTALVFPVLMLSNMLSTGAIGGAVAGEMARAAGAGDRQRAEAVLRAALLVSAAAALLLGVAVVGFGMPLFRILGGDGPVLQAAIDYGRPLFLGIAALWVFNMLASALRGSGDMIRPACVLVVVTALHAGIAALLIFVAGLGVAGAGMALPLAYLVGAVALSAWLVRPGAATRLRPGPVPWSVLRPMLRQGLLAGLQSTLTVGMAMVVTALVGRLGTHWLAGYGIGARLEFLMIPVIFGVGGAMIAMVGANVGAGQRRRAIRIAWTGGAVAAAMVGGIGLACALFPDLWSGLFTDDAATRDAARLYLRIVGPAYLFFGLGLSLYFASQGLNSLVWPVAGTALRLVIVVAGGLLLPVLGVAGPDSLFAVVAAAMAVYGLFIALALHLGPWRPA